MSDPIAKARLLGVERPRALEGGELKSAFSGSGALLPPYEPEALLYWLEHSDAVRSNVEAMEINIEAHGHRLEPAIDLRAQDADDRIADALLAKAENSGKSPTALPSPEEIKAERDRIALRYRIERARAESFLRHAAHEGSFVKLRRRNRVDLESQGNGFWEVLRNQRGEIARFRYVPGYLCRLMPLGPEFIEVEEWEQISPVHYEPVQVERRLRRIVQMDEVSGDLIYFREFGDPRTMSMSTGRFYRSEEELEANEPGARPATEMVHFRLDWPSSPYGVPRWISATPQVQGKRAAAEVNYFLFDNKSVPPLAIFVSGGKLAEGADQKIERFIKEELKGRENWSKILLIEAESGNQGTAPRIEIHRLAKEITEDGLFLKYDERCGQTVGSLFRLPRILRGDTADFNRATAEAALQMAEDLVFSPERKEFDAWMNRVVFPSIGVHTVRFVSLTPDSRNPERVAEMLERLSRIGAVVPKDAREIAADVFNRELAPINAPWQDQPVPFTIAGIQTGREEGNLEARAEELVGLREKLEARGAAQAERRAAALRDSMGGGEITVELSPEAIDELVERKR